MLKKIVSIAAKAAFSIGLIWYATKGLDVATALARVTELPILLLAAAAGVFLVLIINNAFRWHLVLFAVDIKLRFPQVFNILYMGIFFNQVLPSAVGGDAVRIFLLYKLELGWRRAINSVLLERVATLIGLSLLVVSTQPFIFYRIGDTAANWVFPTVAVAGVTSIAVVMLLDRFPERLKAWRVMKMIAGLAEDTRRLFLVPKFGMFAVFMGVTGFSLISLIAYLLAWGLGIEISVVDCLVLIPPVFLITTIPISIAGWGVRETAMIFALDLVGVDSESAALLSILLGILMFITSLPGALIWVRSGYSRRDVARGTAA